MWNNHDFFPENIYLKSEKMKKNMNVLLWGIVRDAVVGMQVEELYNQHTLIKS